jgi:predicted kinase
MKTGSLTVLVGLPGSGKSTYAKAQAGVRVSPDTYLRQAGTGRDPTPADNLAAQEAALAEVVMRLQAGENVIYDHINLTPAVRARVTAALREAGLRPTVTAVYLETDFWDCVAHNTGREFDLNPLNIFYLALTASSPTKAEGYAKVTTLHTKGEGAKSAALAAWLQDPTALPPAAKLRNEVPVLNLLATAYDALGEKWAEELAENHAALVENCAINEITLAKEPELAMAWLCKDLFRIATEYFGTAHPEGELDYALNLNELIFQRVLKSQVGSYGLDLKQLALILGGYYAVAELGKKPPAGATTRLLGTLLVS